MSSYEINELIMQRNLAQHECDELRDQLEELKSHIKTMAIKLQARTIRCDLLHDALCAIDNDYGIEIPDLHHFVSSVLDD